mgnify:CR=1 FL=1
MDDKQKKQLEQLIESDNRKKDGSWVYLIAFIVLYFILR